MWSTHSSSSFYLLGPDLTTSQFNLVLITSCTINEFTVELGLVFFFMLLVTRVEPNSVWPLGSITAVGLLPGFRW